MVDRQDRRRVRVEFEARELVDAEWHDAQRKGEQRGAAPADGCGLDLAEAAAPRGRRRGLMATIATAVRRRQCDGRWRGTAGAAGATGAAGVAGVAGTAASD